MTEYLEEEELQKLIEAAPTAQKKAFLACMYESGARPEEFLRLTNLDTKVDSKGAVSRTCKPVDTIYLHQLKQDVLHIFLQGLI